MLDIHEDQVLVQSTDVEETVERVNTTKEGTQLALTLDGLSTTVGGLKLNKDWESDMWLPGSLANDGVGRRKYLSAMITTEHQENWARGLSHTRYHELLDYLKDI